MMQDDVYDVEGEISLLAYPQGKFDGMLSGYEITFVDGKNTFRVVNKSIGIKGRNIPCKITIKRTTITCDHLEVDPDAKMYCDFQIDQIPEGEYNGIQNNDVLEFNNDEIFFTARTKSNPHKQDLKRKIHVKKYKTIK